MTQPGMRWRAIENAFMSLIKEAIGLESVWTVADGPQPNLPYVQLTWIGFENIGDSGFSDSVNAQGKIERSYYASRTAQVDVQIMSNSLRSQDNALVLSDALMTAFDTVSLADRWLDPVNVAISDFTPAARTLDKIEDNVRVISRVAFTMKVNLAVNVESSEIFDSIETVKMTSELPAGGNLTVSRS